MQGKIGSCWCRKRRALEEDTKKILLSKLTPETKAKIRVSQADKKVLGQWVEVRGFPETMTKMEVRDVLHSVSAVGMKDIILREVRCRVEFHYNEGSEFFTKMVDSRMKLKGTVLRVPPWIFSYSVDQVWDQLEKYANPERKKAQDTKEAGTKVSAVSDKGSAMCLSMGKDQRAATNSTADYRWQPSDLKTFSAKRRKRWSRKKSPKKWSTESGHASKGNRQRTVPRQEQRLESERLLAARRRSKCIKKDRILWEKNKEKVEKAKKSSGIKMILR